MAAGDRGAAANVLFNVAHPVADAGDDRASGPMMELVLDYWPNNYMALYHAGMSEYSLGQTALADKHLRGFLSMYTRSGRVHRRRESALAKIEAGTAPAPDVKPNAEREPHGPAVSGSYLSAGSLFAGRFEIGRELGRGGVSVVYAARDRTVGQDVALKLLVPSPATANQTRERMRREVHAVRGLVHPNIVAVYDFVEDGAYGAVIMELVDGEDLDRRVRRRRAAPIRGCRTPRYRGRRRAWRRASTRVCCTAT